MQMARSKFPLDFLLQLYGFLQEPLTPRSAWYEDRTVFLGLWSRQISAEISVVPIPKTLAEGSSVLLSVSFTGRIFTITWYRGATVGNNQILTYVPSDDPPETVSPPYVGRVRGFPNGSMEISGLTTSDSGSYTVQLQTESSQLPVVTVNITVSVFLGFWSWQISAQISVVPIPKSLAEGSSVLLSVSVTEKILTFTWYRGETTQKRMLLYVASGNPPETVSPPYVGRVRGFPNGSMEISGLTTSDSGSYTVQIQTPSPPPPTATVNITVSANGPVQVSTGLLAAALWFSARIIRS
ncbi:pregnancy-specific glycoprotein 22-like isoform X2 [Rhinatrema bivittatum]|uniref:pregnancy-specific glycoprotein 22-like isoform X2 n=1 Tax=Rhinatrema bivittatum TaxID=194408 RepID=UPI00112DD2DB|nr:pregnancy-specific glycoprotein 22-like isoform X2 [Rhinatrema bivittatum]XP_029432560.1 pregnancy-specific glycoprotein 22-like isoform X2 [Rhinatrema bivittatum]